MKTNTKASNNFLSKGKGKRQGERQGKGKGKRQGKGKGKAREKGKGKRQGNMTQMPLKKNIELFFTYICI